MSDSVDDLKARTAKIRQDMGGAERVATMQAEAKPTIRDHIDALLDDGSFRELGTFSRLANRRIPAPEQRPLSYWPTC